MKKSLLFLLVPTVFLTACGPDHIIADFPSPDGKYHVEVRKCPQRGSLTRSEKTQVSLLPAGASEPCNAFVAALAQFQSPTPDDQLEIQWVSETEVRAWHPGFETRQAPGAASYHQDSPIKVTYSPAR